MKKLLRHLPAFVVVLSAATASWMHTPSVPTAEGDADFSSADRASGISEGESTEAGMLLADRRQRTDRRMDAVPSVLREGSHESFLLLGRALLNPQEDPAVRCEILMQLGRSRDRRSLPLLFSFYHAEPSFPARHLLMKALGDLQEPAARELLREALSCETSVGARVHAALALERPRPSEEERVALRTAALGDPSEEVRLAAMRCLARSGGEDVFLRTVAGLPTASARMRDLAERSTGKP